ncbi:MAG: solute carrier family 23 protein, partial [Anaeroplasmataceae bacterium]
AIFGLVIIAILSYFKVKGAVIIGILSATLLALPLQVASLAILAGNTSDVTWKFWENFGNFFSMNAENGGVFFAMFTEGFNFPPGSLMTTLMLIISLCMIDMFDTMGTIVGCTTSAGLIDEDGKPHNFSKIMYADSIATVAGAMIGTSTVTTFVESSAGVAAGGKTGLTALVCAILFFLSIFLLPLFAFIPQAATASALIYVGVLMMENVKEIDFKNVMESVPAFVTILFMLLTYSITDGIGMGIIIYVIMQFALYVTYIILWMFKKRERPKWNIPILIIIIFVLFLIFFLVPTKF